MLQKLKLYCQLMRLDKPIGILLLLWPTMWALWIAAHGFPSVKNFFIFLFGVILMRSAGCVINDLVDKKFDSQVSRTKNRPLALGKISSRSAIVLFFVLCFMAFILVLFTNALTILLAFFALIIAVIYPFMKRYTHWPQLFLGVAFSFSIPMAFAAQTEKLSITVGILMLANILWTIAYDTEYAMTDRADDLAIGIKSTAVLFGKWDRVIIGLLQLCVIALLCLLGIINSFSFIYFSAIFMGVLLFLYQQYLIATREPLRCFRAFLNNHWVGLVVFVGIFLHACF